jgi:hypothetical protein
MGTLATQELDLTKLTQDPVPNFCNDGSEASRELTVQLNSYLVMAKVKVTL